MGGNDSLGQSLECSIWGGGWLHLVVPSPGCMEDFWIAEGSGSRTNP